MNNRLPIILGALALVAFIAYSSVFVVNERQQAIVLRFGEITRLIKDPGLYFKLPTNIVETVQIVEDRLLRLDLEDITVQVSGGKFYIVDAFVVYRIEDLGLFKERASGNIDQAERLLRTRLNDGLRDVYGRRGFEAALSEERNEMMLEIRELLIPQVRAFGLKVVDVRVRRTDLTPEVSQQTFDRMSAERLAEAERLRARGREAEQRIKAIADRQVVEIVSEARRDSEILRGEGDAERNRVFASAFGRDPEFFEFYRSMSAYESALENSGTTLVLSPDSEFFRYFGAGPTERKLPTAGELAAPAAAAPAASPAVTPPVAPQQ
ncbi:MAG: protease modulator HflC [Rhizobiales bacterium]|nr:protease modulator HflC [Hyphomicrobiales bacterium]